MLTIRIGNIFSDIYGFIPFENYEELLTEMSFRPEGYQFSSLYNRWVMKDGKKIRRMWDGWHRQLWKKRNKDDQYFFPTGLLGIIRTYLKANNIEFKLIDSRIKPEPNINLSLHPSIVLRDYQQKIIDIAVKYGRGLIQSPTASGKTITAAGIIKTLNVSPFIFFVTSKDLLVQAKEDLEEALLINNKPLQVGQIGAGVVDIRDINVMTVQTAVRACGEKYTKFDTNEDDDNETKTLLDQKREEIAKLLAKAKGVISDEVQHWKADTCRLVAKHLKEAYFTYGLSATCERDEGDDLLIQACFGRKIVEITASELIQKKWLMKPYIKIVHIRGQQSKFRQWQQIYKEQVVENQKYNQIISNIAKSYIQNNRLVLILVQQIAHGKTLQSLIPGSIFINGNSPRKKRQEIIQKMRNKEISCIISTVIFDEGINIQSLDTVFLTGQGNSKTRAMQRIGRIMRLHPEKTTVTAIDFRIHQKYLLEHSLKREKIYRTEPEFNIEEIEL